MKIKGSEIFFINDDNSLAIHSLLNTEKSNESFIIRSIEANDIPSYQKWFVNSQIIRFFADGQVKLEDEVTKRCTNWIQRFVQHQPNSALTICRGDTTQPVGFVIAGEGNEVGASEIAGMGNNDFWNLGVGSAALEFIVKKWAPEVRKIAEGEIVEARWPNLRQSFCCFGDAALSKLQATASPLNIASWTILQKYGFQPTPLTSSALSNGMMIDLTNSKLHLQKSDDQQQIIQQFFKIPEQHYKVRDADGREWTASYKEAFGALRYHFELDLRPKKGFASPNL